MKNNTILYCIVTVCLVCVLGLIWKIRLQSRTIDAYGQVMMSERNFIEVRDQIQDLRDKEILTLQSVGCDISGTSVRRDNNPSRVYLRLHEGVCASCYVNSIIDIYKALSDMIPVSIVGSYSYRSAYDDLLRDCNMAEADSVNDISILNHIPADSANIPYIFTLNDRGAVNSILFLDKSVMEPERMEAYRKMVNRRHRE